MQLLHSPVTSSLFGTNIPLRTLLSNALDTCFSLNVTDQVSHPYRTTGRLVVVVYFNLYIPREQAVRQKTLNRMVACFSLSVHAVLIC
jgi:hypothetical protein